MTLSTAVVVYDIALLSVFVLDFVLVSRRNTAVLAKIPAALLAVLLIVLAPMVEDGAIEFAAIGLTVLFTALFGYANFLAFVKRGITFSILHNHAQPPHLRRPDRDFITLDERISEMRSHAWIEGSDEAGWQLTDSGRRVARLRGLLLRVLRIETVG